MRDLDEIDLEILNLLVTDGRRPYREIAEAVGLSPPAVSDRIDRLQAVGIIDQFTVNVNLDALHDRDPLGFTIQPTPNRSSTLFEHLADQEEIVKAWQTAAGTIHAIAYAPDDGPLSWLEGAIGLDGVRELEIEPVVGTHERTAIEPDAFNLACVVCGNTVGSGGELERFNGEVKPFCCESCLSRYEEEYEYHDRHAD